MANWIRMFVGVGATLALAAAGCDRKPQNMVPGTTQVTPAQIDQCKEKMKIKLMPGTKAVGVIDDKPQVQLFLKLEMPKSEVEPFLANSPFAGRKLVEDYRWVSNSGQAEWWTPESAQKYKSGTTEIVPKQQSLNVLIDLDGPEKSVVYLLWFNMAPAGG